MNTLSVLYLKARELNNANLNNKTMLYDCNEDRLASPDKGSPKLFSTLTRYDES